MGFKKIKALVCKQNLPPPEPAAIIPKQFHDEARRSLIKLFRDSLHLNDHANHTSSEVKESLEDDIIEDFQMVSDYIQYLEMWIARSNIIIKD
jgi:hypothetical protein